MEETPLPPESVPSPEPAQAPNPGARLKAMVADARFTQLPADRQRALAAQADPRLGQLDPYAQDRLLTRMAPDPYAFTETRHGLPPGLMKSMHHLESSDGKNLRSKTGVLGPFQITGATGSAYGLPNDQWMDELAQLSTAGNILADNLKTAKGDIKTAVNLYADPNDRGWYADKILGRLQPAGERVQPQSSLPTTTRTTTQQSYREALVGPPAPPDGLALNQMGRIGRDLAGPVDAARALSRLLSSQGSIRDVPGLLGMAAPLNIPVDVVAGAPVEAATGSRGAGDVASLLAGTVPAALQGLARMIRPLTPTARLLGAQAQQGIANVTRGIGEAGQLGEAQQVAPLVQQLAEARAATMAKQAQQGQGLARQAAAREIGPAMRALETAPAPTFHPMTGKMIPPRMTKSHGRVAVPTARVPLRHLSPETQALQTTANQTSQAAADYGTITQPIRQLGSMKPFDVVTRVAKSPDLATALLRDATPADAAYIARAITAGSPVAGVTQALPTTIPSSGLVNRLAQVARYTAMGGGYLHGGPAGMVAGAAVEGVTEIALRKLLDGMLNNPTISKLGLSMMKLDPASASYTAMATRLGELLNRNLNSPSPQ